MRKKATEMRIEIAASVQVLASPIFFFSAPQPFFFHWDGFAKDHVARPRGKVKFAHVLIVLLRSV